MQWELKNMVVEGVGRWHALFTVCTTALRFHNNKKGFIISVAFMFLKTIFYSIV